MGNTVFFSEGWKQAERELRDPAGLIDGPAGLRHPEGTGARQQNILQQSCGEAQTQVTQVQSNIYLNRIRILLLFGQLFQ